MPEEIERAIGDIAEAVGLPQAELYEVYRILVSEGGLTDDVAMAELVWFFGELGLDEHYFHNTANERIAMHVQSLYAAKILSRTRGAALDLHLESEADDSAVYACRADPEVVFSIERRIEQRFPGHRVQSYRPPGVSLGDSGELRLYFVSKPRYPDGADQSDDLGRVAPLIFLDRVASTTKERVQRVVTRAAQEIGPVIEVFDRPSRDAWQIIVGHRRGTTHSYFSAVSAVLNSYGISSLRKYVEPMHNGVVIYSIYIDRAVEAERIAQIREDLSMIYVLPRTSLTSLFDERVLSAQEVVYAYVVWKFAHQFLSRYSETYQNLAPAFATDPVRLGLLGQLKQRLNKDTFTEDRLHEAITRYPELIKQLYADFRDYHFATAECRPKAYDRQQRPQLLAEIKRIVTSDLDGQIFSAFLSFNRHVLKTNFYRDAKIALAFRLDPAFINEDDYPERPYGIFFVIGSEFRGFHVRFRDVARGGVRIISSAIPMAYARNVDTLFHETYQLALTQQRKNKDIPEGGAKGTILLSLEHQDKQQISFQKYVDALLDLLIQDDEVYDHLGQEELLFLGPDEGTAELMDWAAERARLRGYPYWRAFTTGKSAARGGIPHERYGMTTRSLHQFVLGVLREHGLEESQITKAQTGGPDGDLGSNEIKISSDRTIAVVDGSGVLYDPTGIDRGELLRLADARLPVAKFSIACLGEQGFLVTVGQRNVCLPDGTLVESGLTFRNGFHLSRWMKADLFVPCGGRPEAVHINNVTRLIDPETKLPKVRFVVEGANLFFTQQARLALEEAGVVIFKDASANKGGVTSSSLEVFAALALGDQYAHHMQVTKDTVPPFYLAYIGEVHRAIEDNARAEFSCLWREHLRTKLPLSVLSDMISEKINALNDEIQAASLWDDQRLRSHVLEAYCPEMLLEEVGMEQLLQRVPPAYLRAVFGAYLASRYVYLHGLDTSEVKFFEFLAAQVA